MKRFFIILVIGLSIIGAAYYYQLHTYKIEMARITSQLSQQSTIILDNVQHKKVSDLSQLYVLQQQTHDLFPPVQYRTFHRDFSGGLDLFILSVQYYDLQQPTIAHAYATQANALLDKALNEMP